MCSYPEQDKERHENSGVRAIPRSAGGITIPRLPLNRAPRNDRDRVVEHSRGALLLCGNGSGGISAEQDVEVKHAGRHASLALVLRFLLCLGRVFARDHLVALVAETGGLGHRRTEFVGLCGFLAVSQGDHAHRSDGNRHDGQG